MNKKTIVVLVLVLVLLLSVSSILVINGFPELTLDWSNQSRYVGKQYIKVVGFLSIMGLVYILVEELKITKPEKQEEENKIEE